MQNINESLFEQIRQIDEAGNEYWSVRQFAKVIEYVGFIKFERILNKAKQACENSGYTVADHMLIINNYR